MNREVMGRQMFAHGGSVYPMQDGGIAPMPPMPEQAPPAPMAPEGMGMEQAAQGAAAQGVDPAQLEGMLGGYQQQMSALDGAEDYETVINSIRGDELPMDARYAELAEMVGQEDASSTPESVLTLIQPVMQLAVVDQGIGGLAQDEMSAPIEGPLAGGIMSTVNMGAPEGPDPVNFNQGGPVRYMADAGVVHPNDQNAANLAFAKSLGAGAPSLGGRQSELFKQQQDFYKSALLDPEQQAADLEEQKQMTKAQMLFDVAQGALAFASPGDRQMSPAERLAQSFSPVLGSIGARAGELNKFKQAQGAEEKQYDLAALQSAQGIYSEENAATAAEGVRLQAIIDAEKVALTKANAQLVGSGNPMTITYGDGTAGSQMSQFTQIVNVGQLKTLQAEYPFVKAEKPSSNALVTTLYDVTYTGPDNVKTVKKGQLLTQSEIADLKKNPKITFSKVTTDSKPVWKTVYFPSDPDRAPQEMLVGSTDYQAAIVPVSEGGSGGISAAPTKDDKDSIKRTEKTLLKDIVISGVTYKKGKTINLTDIELDNIPPDSFTTFDASTDSIKRTQKTLLKDIVINGVTFKKGESPNFTDIELNSIPPNSFTAFDSSSDAATKINLILMENEAGDTLNIRSDNGDAIDQALLDGFKQITTPAGQNDPKASRVIRLLGNQVSLDAYANGTMDATELNEFEQTAMNSQVPSSRTENGVTITTPGRPFSRSFVEAYEARVLAGFPTSTIQMPKIPRTVSQARLQLEAAQKEYGINSPEAAQILSNIVDKNTGSVNRNMLATREFNEMLLTTSGLVDLKSPAWAAVPTSIYSHGVDYDLAQGFGTFIPRLVANFREVTGQIGLGSRINDNDQMLYRADNDFKMLKLDTLSKLQAGLQEGRILKRTNDEIFKVLDTLNPGVMMFDVKTLAAMETITEQLGRDLSTHARILAEYGGDPSKASDEKIRKSGESAFELRGLISEYLKVQTALRMALDPSFKNVEGQVLQAGGQSVQKKKNSIYNLANPTATK